MLFEGYGELEPIKVKTLGTQKVFKFKIPEDFVSYVNSENFDLSKVKVDGEIINFEINSNSMLINVSYNTGTYFGNILKSVPKVLHSGNETYDVISAFILIKSPEISFYSEYKDNIWYPLNTETMVNIYYSIKTTREFTITLTVATDEFTFNMPYFEKNKINEDFYFIFSDEIIFLNKYKSTDFIINYSLNYRGNQRKYSSYFNVLGETYDTKLITEGTFNVYELINPSKKLLNYLIYPKVEGYFEFSNNNLIYKIKNNVYINTYFNLYENQIIKARASYSLQETIKTLKRLLPLETSIELIADDAIVTKKLVDFEDNLGIPFYCKLHAKFEIKNVIFFPNNKILEFIYLDKLYEFNLSKEADSIHLFVNIYPTKDKKYPLRETNNNNLNFYSPSNPKVCSNQKDFLSQEEIGDVADVITFLIFDTTRCLSFEYLTMFWDCSSGRNYGKCVNDKENVDDCNVFFKIPGDFTVYIDEVAKNLILQNFPKGSQVWRLNKIETVYMGRDLHTVGEYINPKEDIYEAIPV